MSKQDSQPTAPSVLAEITGRDESDFEPDFGEYPLPDPEDLVRVPAKEFYDDE